MRMRVSLIVFICFCISQSLFGQASNSWLLFEKASFKDVYLEDYGAYASLLNEDPEIMALNNLDLTIKGYHIPVMEEGLVVLSKYPNANCFFCGGAGLESVMEVRLKEKPEQRFEMDEKLTFRGKLVVNSTDYNILSFILEDAELLKRER